MAHDADPRVLIVGAGPAGLAAAHALARQGIGGILVIDRDDEPGGLPRYCHHPGFGLEYARWPYTGPGFVKRLLGDLKGADVRIACRTTLLSLREGPEAELVGPALRPAPDAAAGRHHRHRDSRIQPRQPRRAGRSRGGRHPDHRPAAADRGAQGRAAEAHEVRHRGRHRACRLFRDLDRAPSGTARDDHDRPRGPDHVLRAARSLGAPLRHHHPDRQQHPRDRSEGRRRRRGHGRYATGHAPVGDRRHRLHGQLDVRRRPRSPADRSRSTPERPALA